MDYFGSFFEEFPFFSSLLFQSFWVNGLLWKNTREIAKTFWFLVSILLGQWITLEEDRERPHANEAKVSILLGQWITLEDYH